MTIKKTKLALATRNGRWKSFHATSKWMFWTYGKLAVVLVFLLAGCVKRQLLFLDTFSTDHLSSGYHWVNDPTDDDPGNPDQYSFTIGHLKIEAGKRQDLWGGSEKTGAPLMLRLAPTGDYFVETFVNAYPQPVNTQTGLFVFKDEDNWIFFGLTHHNFTFDVTHQGDGLMVTKTESGSSSPMPIGGAADTAYPTHHLTQDSLYLRINRQGDDWKFYWKLNHDDTWNLLTSVNFALGDHEIGMGVKTFDIAPSGDENEGQAEFDFFLIGRIEE
jgi:regulation of enolase protein 1 (concanavalin A-like superfamily)